MDKHPYRILVIEDNPGDFFVVEELLNDQFANLVIIHNSTFKEATQTLSSPNIPPDVILLDLSLPDKSGQPLISEILRMASSLPVIILTGYADLNFSIQSISQGILDYVHKDGLNSELLCKSIIYSIERKKAISELKESEKRYSDLFNLSPQPMWIFDTESLCFLQVNKATIVLYGYTEQEFLNMSLSDIKQQGDVSNIKDNISNASPTHEILQSSIKHRKKSGEIIEVEIYSNPIVINNKSYQSVIVIDVTEKRQLEHKIIKAIIKTQEDERYEIGGELHDNVCQILGASLLGIGMLKKVVPKNKLILFEQCRTNINLALAEIRNLSHRLAPVFLDELTLQEAFLNLFDNFNVEKKLKIVLTFDSRAKDYPLGLEIRRHLYRILQEQLSNILKYANANLVQVCLSVDDSKLRMTITDDGIGFDAAEIKGGIGLSNIKRRSELFAGNLEIISSPGKGCQLIIDISLQEITKQVVLS